MRSSSLMLFLAAAVLLVLAGCTTAPPVLTPTLTVPTPEPTQTLPPGQGVTLQVNQKDPIYDTITVVFAGGEGQIAVTNIIVKVTLSDGKTETKQLSPVKGEEVRFQGTRETDRVEAWVTLNNGKTYKTVDTLLPHRTRP
jgi:ABC-type transport system substrate-binding protein